MLNQAKKLLLNGIYGTHLPCHILSESPAILVSYFVDCYNHLEAIAEQIDRRFPDQPVYLFFQLGYHVETPKRLNEVKIQYLQVSKRMPFANLCFLTNSPIESENLKLLGINAIFAHQNAFLDARRYPLLETVKRYDAIYLARFTPAKRHYLAQKVSSLKLIGDHMLAEQHYYDESRRILQHADIERKVYSFQVAKALSQARVGLCLSAEEGAMFVSAEYLLSGLPVVTTPNLGGRNHLMPEDYFFEVEANPEAVAEAVQTCTNHQFDTQDIRAQTLAKIAEHRIRFVNQINEIRDQHDKPPLTKSLPHKLCLRMRVPFSLRKQML